MLIESNELKNRIRDIADSLQSKGDEWVVGLIDVDKAITELESKGTQEVRHGKWVFMERREPQYDITGVKTWGVAYRCSNCGFVHSVIEDFGHYAFCPNCGAKMDLKVHYCDRNKCLQMEYDGKGCDECEAEE